MDQKNKVEIFQSPAELTEATGKFIIEAAKKAIDTNGRFVISLSGGHTPEHLYSLLSKPPFADQISWDKTFVFWGDERCVPSDDKQNNANMAKTLLLHHIDMPQGNIFPVPVDLEPAAAAQEYEQTITSFFGDAEPQFDLILLGLGENGHTASLFPGTKVVHEQKRLVKEVFVEEQKMFRITMTATLIDLAHNIMFLVEGDGKAEIIKTVLTGAYLPDKYPAQLIKPVNGKLYWYLDSKAAALLPEDM